MAYDANVVYPVATLIAATIALFVRYCFRSKCVNVKLCYGLIDIQRDVEEEVKNSEIEQTSMQRQTSADHV